MRIENAQRAWVASLLSVLFPGLGFVYLGRPGLALIAAAGPLALIILGFSWSLFSFAALVATLFLVMAAQVFQVVYAGVKTRDFSRGNRRWFTHGGLIALAGVLLSFVVQPALTSTVRKCSRYLPVHQPGSSMEPTFLPGDRFVLDRAYFRSHALSRGDLVAVEGPEDGRIWFNKRVVGLPGDVVEIRNGILYRNGGVEIPTYPVLSRFEDPRAAEDPYHLFNFGPITLEADQIFCLGDNRPNSLDCRFWGPLKVGAVVGKPLYIYWSSDAKKIGARLA